MAIREGHLEQQISTFWVIIWLKSAISEDSEDHGESSKKLKFGQKARFWSKWPKNPLFGQILEKAEKPGFLGSFWPPEKKKL